ncbi:MAG: Crp/Fnr family transcriptional regulator [Cyanobacteria bacterium Co-bin8]|nr:Crp/Fnr family transcriptional regulator [Cyanobacteria bacterium Co-bin8]
MFNPEERKISHNYLLDSLPLQDFGLIWPRLEEVELSHAAILHGIREPITEVYFPTAGLLSWVNVTPLGEEIEMGVTGNEGMAGIPLFLNEGGAPWQVQVQIKGQALRLEADTFLEILDQSTTLQKRVAAFTYLKIVQLSQSVLCNRFHRVEERLCRWLLAAQDCTETSELLLTRDVLAQMIGSGRPTVSLVTGELQSAGLISATRGKITILDRKGLEATACDCYRLVKQEFNHYINERLRS